jgi:hypothetical protein
MKPRHLLKELEQLAQTLGLSVRTQAFRSSTLSVGGLCKLKGRPVILLNSRTQADERALALANILRDMDTTRISISDDVQELLSAPKPGHRTALSKPALSKQQRPGLRQARPKVKLR